MNVGSIIMHHMGVGVVGYGCSLSLLGYDVVIDVNIFLWFIPVSLGRSSDLVL